jgi:hypothetical protein
MTHILSINFFGGEFFFDFLYYSKLLHLLPLRFHSVRGFWDRTQDYTATSPLTVRRSNYSARSHPQKLKNMHKAYVNLKTLFPKLEMIIKNYIFMLIKSFKNAP